MISLLIDPEIDFTRLPRHVAIIMDGNGRWAKKRLLNRVQGHGKGADTVRTIVRTCHEIKLPILTLYAFSTENWCRPKKEVDALMMLFSTFLKSEQGKLKNNNIRLNALGQIDRLPQKVQKALHDTMDATKENNGMLLNIAVSYGGRSEIVRAVKNIALKVKKGLIDPESSPESITEQLITEHLYTSGMDDPDLLIRTSGEKRISNFLLWQIAYSEIFVTDTLWPDFNKDELLSILKNYQNRERRFGKL